MQLCAHSIHVSRILMKQLSWETYLILCLIVHQHSEWYLHQASTKESIHWYVKPISGWLAAHSDRPVYSQSSAAALYWRIVYQCLVITSLIYHQQTIERPLTYHWHLSLQVVFRNTIVDALVNCCQFWMFSWFSSIMTWNDFNLQNFATTWFVMYREWWLSTDRSLNYLTNRWSTFHQYNAYTLPMLQWSTVDQSCNQQFTDYRLMWQATQNW